MDFMRLNKLYLMMMYLLTSWMLGAFTYDIFFPHFSLTDFLLLLMMKMHLLTWIVVALDFEYMTSSVCCMQDGTRKKLFGGEILIHVKENK